MTAREWGDGIGAEVSGRRVRLPAKGVDFCFLPRDRICGY